ncbi:hypothetical protein 12VC501_gene0054 [Vibrio phage 12VC501]|nr:hypothetical protein 12VC501_gene0054 [Vibrio phage 12VC501]
MTQVTRKGVKIPSNAYYLENATEVYIFNVAAGIVAVIGHNKLTEKDFFRNQMNIKDARIKWKTLVEQGYKPLEVN